MHIFTHSTHNGTFLADIDPRVKLLCSLALLLMVISGKGLLLPLVTTLLCIGICIRAGVRLRSLALRFAEPAFIILMIVLLKLFCSGHAPLFSVSLFGIELTGYREGLTEGLMIATRIIGAVSVVNALAAVTPFTELMAAFSWLRLPQAFIEVTLFAWRYLFLLHDDARVIYAAQKNRLGYTGYRTGLRSFGTLAGTLVIKAFDNSRTVTTAMLQRGYDGNLPMLKHKPFRIGEVAASLMFIVCMGILWKL
ncbi:MAG: cobalt ECF transporter T component CbiQ [Geobacteraceae bacterium]|nr:cobalt ECF transporter T component CbiQ [Geobacteraceae bacterium]